MKITMRHYVVPRYGSCVFRDTGRMFFGIRAEGDAWETAKQPKCRVTLGEASQLLLSRQWLSLNSTAQQRSSK